MPRGQQATAPPRDGLRWRPSLEESWEEREGGGGGGGREREREKKHKEGKTTRDYYYYHDNIERHKEELVINTSPPHT